MLVLENYDVKTCIYCGSADIEYEHHDIFGEDWLYIECNNCKEQSRRFNPIQHIEEDL